MKNLRQSPTKKNKALQLEKFDTWSFSKRLNDLTIWLYLKQKKKYTKYITIEHILLRLGLWEFSWQYFFQGCNLSSCLKFTTYRNGNHLHATEKATGRELGDSRKERKAKSPWLRCLKMFEIEWA